MIGQRIGQYEIVEEIGRGGMATVFRAKQLNADRSVAIKVIHSNIAGDKSALERFVREARLVARLEHPYIIPVYDYDGLHNPPYIVMRFLESGTLKDVLDRGALPLTEIAYMMRQITSALDYAHRQGVIHRDIKPSNIMIDAEGNAYLTDFGIARFSESGNDMTGLTHTGLTVGTPGYMAPEQGLGQKVDERADIYAVGVMLFQMATGSMPYSAETPMALVLKHIQAPIPSPISIKPDLPPEFDFIIRKAMAKEPTDRYQSGRELSDAITQLVGMSSLTEQPTMLRTVALNIIDDLRRARDEKGTSTNITPVLGYGNRPPQSTPYPTPNTPYGNTPYGNPPYGNTPYPPPPAQGGNRTPLLLGGLLVIIVLVGVVIMLLAGGDGNNTPVDTEPTRGNVVVILSTNTESPDDSESPTDTDSVLPSNTPSDEASETPDNANVVVNATDTPTPTDTPTDRPTNTPLATNTDIPTPSTPIVQARSELIVRLGPGSSYPAMNTIPNGMLLDIVGISVDGRWYQVLLPDGSDGWVLSSRSFVAPMGNIADIQVVEAPTNTPTFTPTITPSPTDTLTATPSPTDTDVPTLTFTPLPTNIPSDTPTSTPSATPAPTDTPSITPSPTSALDLTSTKIAENFFATQTEFVTTRVAVLPTPTYTPTPQPQGGLPYIADFEIANPIAEWDYDPATWQVVNEDGQKLLLGRGRIDSPIVVMGNGRPDWLAPEISNFVISTDFNLENGSGGARIVFRYSDDGGYQALELFPGLVILRRNNLSNPDVLNRDAEILIRQTGSAPISDNTWHNVTIWVDGRRIYVYIDGRLLMTAEDNNTPELGVGQILLQVNASNRSVRFDNFTVQQAEAFSNHFEGAIIPATWQTNNSLKSTIVTESRNNFVQVDNDVEIKPANMTPIQDFTLRARMWSTTGGYKLYLRESSAGSLMFELNGGNLTITHFDANGSVVFTRRVDNFYTRNVWQLMEITFVGDRLKISLEGRIRFEDTLTSSPPAGTIRIVTGNADYMRFDDFLVTQTASTANTDAQFAFALQTEVLARNFRQFRSDVEESFSTPLEARYWWVGNQSADGDYLQDPASPTNQTFLRMIYLDRPTFRLIRNDYGVQMFGTGTDRRTYADSTDIYATVFVRIPNNESGIASLGVRVTTTVTGLNMEGYFLDVRRNSNGTVEFIARYSTASEEIIYYEGAIPGAEDSQLPVWIPLKIIVHQDKIAFFANDYFITAQDNISKLGGTVSLSVGEGSTGDFDTLLVRDTSPQG